MTGSCNSIPDFTNLLSDATVYIGENIAQPTQVILHIYDKQSYQKHYGYDRALIEDAITNDQQVWVDVHGLANTDAISQWCHDFNVHPLIVEDILHTHQRPKLDCFHGGLFIVFKVLEIRDNKLTYNSEQFSMVVKKNVLLTFRESADYDLSQFYNRLSGPNSMVRQEDCDYLAYLLMDDIVDDYFSFVDEMEQDLSKMEDLLVADPRLISLSELYTNKRRNMVLRKIIVPLRDIVHLLLTEYVRNINDKYHLYYRDLHDHTIRLLETIDLQREMTSSMFDIYHSTLNIQMNQTIKLLTLFTSIFIPLTFIVGVYGMNFEFMPELKWRYAYPTVLGIMATLVVSMVYYFKKKKIL